RLSRFGLCDDHTALTFPDRGKEIKDTCRHVVRRSAELDHLVGEQRCKVFERDAVADFLCRFSVYRFYAKERKIFFSFLRRTYLATHCVAGLETEELDLRR